MRVEGIAALDVAESVLIAHQRRDVQGCICGWAKLGQIHARHQVQMLVNAGVLEGDFERGPIK